MVFSGVNRYNTFISLVGTDWSESLLQVERTELNDWSKLTTLMVGQAGGGGRGESKPNLQSDAKDVGSVNVDGGRLAKWRGWWWVTSPAPPPLFFLAAAKTSTPAEHQDCCQHAENSLASCCQLITVMLPFFASISHWMPWTFMFERESGGARLSGVYRFSVFWGRLAASPRSSASMGRKKEGKKAGCQTSCSEESSPSSCPPSPSLFSPQCLAVFPETKHANTCSGFWHVWLPS